MSPSQVETFLSLSPAEACTSKGSGYFAILDYLLTLKMTGLSLSSLQIYLAAISACHLPSGYSIFIHPVTAQFLKGLLRTFQPANKPIPHWDFNLVLWALTKSLLAVCSIPALSKVLFLVPSSQGTCVDQEMLLARILWLWVDEACAYTQWNTDRDPNILKNSSYNKVNNFPALEISMRPVKQAIFQLSTWRYILCILCTKPSNPNVCRSVCVWHTQEIELID